MSKPRVRVPLSALHLRNIHLSPLLIMTQNKKKSKLLKRVLGGIAVIAVAAGGNVMLNGSSDNVVPSSTDTNLVRTEKNVRMEIPNFDGAKHGQQLKRKGFTLSYDSEMGTPQWVAWELTREETKGRLERTDWFEMDNDVKGKKVDYNDYSGSGYDRGHMAPAGDMKWDMQAMEESFLMSNICPQNHALNKGSWNDLEIEIRQWAKRYGKAYVVCGPIYEPDRKIKRIGKSRVAVPHYFYKAVLIYPNKKPLALGFVFSNDGKHGTISQSIVSIDQLEKRTGLDFFSALPDDEENALEAVTAKMP